ncbi:MAG: GFA family protein [Pseudomonadota bacterium]
MDVTGSCHCGFLAFKATVEPGTAIVCHCTDCQKLSGSAFRWTIPSVAGAFAFTAGEPTVYVKTAESGNPRVQAFCPKCGTQIYSSPVKGENMVHRIRVGTIDQRGELTPTLQRWNRSRLDWLSELEEIEARQTV